MDYEIEPIVDHLYKLIREQEADELGATGRKKTAARMVGDKWKSQLASLISKYKTGKKEQWKDWLESNPYEAQKLADQCLLNPNAPLCKQLLQPCPEGQTRDPKTGECVKGEDPPQPDKAEKPEKPQPEKPQPGTDPEKPANFENPPLKLPVLTLVKLDNNGVKFYRNTKRGDKQVDAVLALMARARKQGIVGNNTSPYTSNDLDKVFGVGGRKMTNKTPDELGGYDAMMRAILPKGRKISDSQTYFTVDASIYSDIAKVTNRPEEEIYEPVTKIVQSFLKRLVKSKEGSRGAVSVDDAIKSIKYRFRNKIGNEELQSVLSILQAYGLAQGASGKELKPRKRKRRGGKERRRMRENIDTIVDTVADILIEKFGK